MSSSNASSQPIINQNAEASFSNFPSASSTAPKWKVHKPQYDAAGQALDAMARKYSVCTAENELSVEELLALPPLPRSFRHELTKEAAGRGEMNEDGAKEKLEAAKRKLRSLAAA